MVEGRLVVGEHREWRLALRERTHRHRAVEFAVRHVEIMADRARRYAASVQVRDEARHRKADVLIERGHNTGADARSERLRTLRQRVGAIVARTQAVLFRVAHFREQ